MRRREFGRQQRHSAWVMIVMGNLMARLNVREMLCMIVYAKVDVPFRRNGSLVLAFNDEDVFQLERLMVGCKNGVADLRLCVSS